MHCLFPWNFHCYQESWLCQFEPVEFSDESPTFRFPWISHNAHFKHSFFLQSLHFCGFFTVTFLRNFCNISDLAKQIFSLLFNQSSFWGKFCGFVTVTVSLYFLPGNILPNSFSPWVQSVLTWKFSAESPTFTFFWPCHSNISLNFLLVTVSLDLPNNFLPGNVARF